MRQKILLAASFFLSLRLSAQEAITLTSDNFPPLTTYDVIDGMGITNFPFGYPTPETWDFGTEPLVYGTTLYYPDANDPFFSASADSYSTSSRTLFGAVYGVQNYVATTADYFGEVGHKIQGATSSLTAYSGGINDVVVIPVQNQLFDEPRIILDFPATMGSMHHSDSRRITNFNVTVEAYGLDNTPGQMITHVIRHDTIVSYGQMRVYIPSVGASEYYDVLAMKSWQYELDSFYLGGSPAPPALLSAFGLSQQTVPDDADVNNRLYFYRENNAAPLLLMTFGSSPFEAYTGIFIHGDNLAVAGSEELAKDAYQVFVYPNPGNGKNTTIEFLGKDVPVVSYTITDISGKTVHEQKNVSVANNKLSLQADLQPGNYFVQVKDKQENVIAVEKIQVQ
ncbi:MAG: hypothetical protein K0R65_3069 [Crocinitomicaceae bacterium]|jgi:hypothetical protein|nr:hypothetical protein [Crocinitomicaceae bacterium]